MQIEWTESYSCHKAEIAGVLTVNVNWTSEQGGGYKVSVTGRSTWSLSDLSKDLEDGKRRALALARRKLAAAVAALEA